MTSTRGPATRHQHADPTENLSKWVGWVAFAGIVMATAGILNVLQGVIALFNDDFYAAAGSKLVALDYTTWGWLLVATGVLLMVTGYGVIMGTTWARIVGVLLITIAAVVNFAFMAAFPVWSILAVSLNLIAIFAVAVHGREAQVLRS